MRSGVVFKKTSDTFYSECRIIKSIIIPLFIRHLLTDTDCKKLVNTSPGVIFTITSCTSLISFFMRANIIKHKNVYNGVCMNR